MGRSAFGSTLRESALLSSDQHLRWKDGLVSHWLCGRPSLDLGSLTLETVWAFPIAVRMMEMRGVGPLALCGHIGAPSKGARFPHGLYVP